MESILITMLTRARKVVATWLTVTTGHVALRAVRCARAKELGTEEVPTHFVQTIR